MDKETKQALRELAIEFYEFNHPPIYTGITKSKFIDLAVELMTHAYNEGIMYERTNRDTDRG